MNNLLTFDELEKKLKVSRRTIYNYIKKRGLPKTKVGDTVRFDEQEVNEWIKKQNK